MKELLVILLLFVPKVRFECLQNKTKHEQVNHQVINIKLEQTSSFLKESFYESSNKDSDPSDCSKEETEKQQNLVMANQLINKGLKEINKQNFTTKNTILVIGNAGVGKSTFIEFMAGDNSKLLSKQVGSGLYLIEDGKKIGSSLCESFTLYPEQVLITGYDGSFTDTAGFSDTRSPEHEMAATFVMKKYLKNIKNIKIVLLVNYHSVQEGIYKNDFIELLRNVFSLIRDIQKYKNHIVLIATKVPAMYKKEKHDILFISDKKIIEGIAEYLLKLKISLNEKLLNSRKEKETIFLTNCMQFIHSFLETDTNGGYKKISIFHQPSKSGSVSKLQLLQSGKDSIKKTVYENINYTNLLEDDIGFVLSDRTKNNLNCLLWYINDKIINMTSFTYSLIKKHYELEINSYTDIYELYVSLNEVLKKLKTLKNDLKLSKNYENYTKILKQFASDENILSDVIHNTDFEVKEYLNNLQQFTNTSSILSTDRWSEQIEELLNFMKENLSWYRFLIKVFEHLSSYKIQISKSNLCNPIHLCKNTSDSIKTVLFNIDGFFYKDFESYFNFTNLREDRKLELEDLMSFTIENNTNISCDSDGKLIITDYYIVLSLLKNTELNRQYCGNNTIKTIVIYGFYKVFIDTDLKENYFKGIDLIIAAPKWEIIGKQEINIAGFPGRTHNILRAENGTNYGENGKNGLAGLPGGNGGNFLGILWQIENEENLIISLKGGKGGQGQNGGNGKNGFSGKDGLQKFIRTPKDNEYNEIWGEGLKIFPQSYTTRTTPNLVNMTHRHCGGKIRVYFRDGDCGENGGFGGTGGAGGAGGYPGTILLLGLNDPPKFTVKMSHGASGDPGINGNDGQKGEDGKPVTCFKTFIRETKITDHKFFWRCTNLTYYNTIKCSKNIDILRLNSTKFNFSPPDTLISLPVQAKVHDFSIEISHYRLLLKNIRKNKFISKYIGNFLNQIYKKLTMKNDKWEFNWLNETLSSIKIW